MPSATNRRPYASSSPSANGQQRCATHSMGQEQNPTTAVASEFAWRSARRADGRRKKKRSSLTKNGSRSASGHASCAQRQPRSPPSPLSPHCSVRELLTPVTEGSAPVEERLLVRNHVVDGLSCLRNSCVIVLTQERSHGRCELSL